MKTQPTRESNNNPFSLISVLEINHIMTKFEELLDIINRKRSSEKQNSQSSNESEELEVLGSDSTFVFF